MKLFLLLPGVLFLGGIAYSQKATRTSTNEKLKAEAASGIEAGFDVYKQIALHIWEYGEGGFKEFKSSLLLQNTLKANSFTVEAGIAGMPTAFVATYGSGQPVIGILAEFDALPGLSQDTTTTKQPITNRNYGHACGHHLLGTGAAAAANEIKKLMEEGKIKGTIKVFGCPAEEGGGGKVYMVRDGWFNHVDVVLHWHPEDNNQIIYTSALANTSAKFRFYGIAAHASAAPEKGRSALDAVESMDYMVNMMREHIPQESRIHYVITQGGKAPNVVPDFAEVYYYVRNPERSIVESLFQRIVKAADGAALGTGTTMNYELISGTHDLLLNKTLALLMQSNLEKVGGVKYTPAEIIFAKKLQASFIDSVASFETAAMIQPLHTGNNWGSTDVGDVSYVVPTVGLKAATWVPGTAAHSWQAVACGGTDIGMKGMIVAAKTMVFTAIDLFTNPSWIKNSWEEFNVSKGHYQYKALLGNRTPALNYRD